MLYCHENSSVVMNSDTGRQNSCYKIYNLTPCITFFTARLFQLFKRPIPHPLIQCWLHRKQMLHVSLFDVFYWSSYRTMNVIKYHPPPSSPLHNNVVVKTYSLPVTGKSLCIPTNNIESGGGGGGGELQIKNVYLRRNFNQ